MTTRVTLAGAAAACKTRDVTIVPSITSPQFAEGYSYQVVSRKLNESAIIQKAPDGKLLTAAIVDPEPAAPGPGGCAPPSGSAAWTSL